MGRGGFLGFFCLSIFRPIISLKLWASQLLLSCIFRSSNQCSVTTSALGYTSLSLLRAVPVFLPVPAQQLAPPAAWSEAGDVIALTHSASNPASPARTGFLSLWGGREVFDSSVVRCFCDKPVLNSSRFKVAFKYIIN